MAEKRRARGDETREKEIGLWGGWSVGGLGGYIRKVRMVESRRGAVAKESLTHLPLSWLRPPTPIPCTRPKLSFPSSTVLVLLERATPDYTLVPAAAAAAAACQVACLPCLPACGPSRS